MGYDSHIWYRDAGPVLSRAPANQLSSAGVSDKCGVHYVIYELEPIAWVSCNRGASHRQNHGHVSKHQRGVTLVEPELSRQRSSIT